MKTLLLLRHAKSSWKDSELRDHERPLKKRGKRDAPRVGRHLQAADIMPDLILSSDARRALDTASLVMKAAGYEGAYETDPGLYLAGPEAIADRLRSVPAGADRVMIVGHNPGLEDLLGALLGQYERVPTAALAQLEVEVDNWPDFTLDSRATLVGLWRPRDLE